MKIYQDGIIFNQINDLCKTHDVLSSQLWEDVKRCNSVKDAPKKMIIALQEQARWMNELASELSELTLTRPLNDVTLRA